MTLDTRVGTVATVRWTSHEAGDARLEVGADDHYGRVVEGWSSADGHEHSVVLAGLAGGEVWHWRAVTRTDAGDEVSDDQLFAPPAPPPEVPSFEASGETDGYVLVTVVASTSAVVLLDDEGRAVWWYVPADGIVVTQARMAANGRDVLLLEADANLVADLGTIVRVPLAGGEVVRTRAERAHHDFVELDDGRLAYLQVEIRPFEGEDVAADGVVELDEATGATEVVWSAWDTLPTDEIDPALRFYEDDVDWTHANALVHDADDDRYWVSLHNLDALVLVDPGSGEIVHRFGEGPSDVALTAGEPFHGQHGPALVPEGFVVFDNGDPTTGSLASRAVEYAVDEAAGTWREVWSFAGDRALWSPFLGNVERLGDESTLVNWGGAGRLSRVGPDGSVGWQADVELGAALGFAHVVPDVGGAP
ncbi:MAG: aryl-sulfate sulfotransferase [Myxococcota bacterium]